MIKLEQTNVEGWETAIRGMRNPLNSWEKSDSVFYKGTFGHSYDILGHLANEVDESSHDICNAAIGPNDLDLMKRLRNAGTDHGKFMRFITVTCDITAPLYWWKEFDTYKVGTVANSCSTMHKIQAKEFVLDDFSHDRLLVPEKLQQVIDWLNEYRTLYVEWDDSRKYIDDNKVELRKKDIWWQMIQLLPSSYNQKRTVQLNYAVLRSMYFARRNHKLDEWKEFCKWIETLPYSELITME